MLNVTSSMIAAFRSYYDEFVDTTTWPDADVQRHLEDAVAETGGRWGEYTESPLSLRARGMFAYTAHKLVLRRAAKNAVAAGGTPAAPQQAESKQVGDEQVTHAVARPQSMNEADGSGDLRSTIYGQEFLRLRRRAGMGAATTGSVSL